MIAASVEGEGEKRSDYLNGVVLLVEEEKENEIVYEIKSEKQN